MSTHPWLVLVSEFGCLIPLERTRLYSIRGKETMGIKVQQLVTSGFVIILGPLFNNSTGRSG